MQYRRLGRTDLDVSQICLGTMTWGEQNSEVEAHAQLDLALECGVNFVDAAEMYPVPPRPETQGRTEEYLGSWFASRGLRNKWLLASKVTGPGHDYIRNNGRLDRANVIAACEASLRRLQTDRIDLYQVHWPDRPVNSFRKLMYPYRDDAQAVPIDETLEALDRLQRDGKIVHIGVSNETPWGVSEYLRLSRDKGLPRIQSVQNPYSLLNRSFEVGLSEFSHREDTGLLAYSPLAMGALSGKHLNGIVPNSRFALFTRFTRYQGEHAEAAVRAYVALAREHDLDPAQMALAFVLSRPFTTAAIIGATTLAQLRSNIESIDVSLSPEVLAGFEEIHAQYTFPCP